MFEDDGQFPPLVPRHELGESERLAAQCEVEALGDRRVVVWPTAANITDWSHDPTSGSVEITDAGRDALMRSEGYESNSLSLFRERQRINAALSKVEQVAFMRRRSLACAVCGFVRGGSDDRHCCPDCKYSSGSVHSALCELARDRSGAQPHRFRSAE
jgi:hypothetical protein